MTNWAEIVEKINGKHAGKYKFETNLYLGDKIM